MTELDGFLSLAKTIGPLGGLIVFVVLWVTRSLIPRLQEEAASARSTFAISLDRISNQFSQGLDKVVENCRQERAELLDLLQERKNK